MRILIHKSCWFLCLLSLFTGSKAAFSSMEWNGHVLEGQISNELNMGHVQGAQGQSFIDEGVNYVTELNLHYSRHDWTDLGEFAEGWSTEAQIDVRKTDDRQVDRRRDLHLLQLNLHAYTDTFDLQYGDIYVHLSDYTVNQSLEGFRVDKSFTTTGTRILNTAAQVFGAEEELRYSRYVLGNRLEQTLFVDLFNFGENFLLNEWTIGANAAYAFDNSASVDRETGLRDISNLVWSLDSNLKLFDEHFSSRAEVARAKTKDHHTAVIDGVFYATAVKIKNEFFFDTGLGSSRANFDYEQVDPGFFTLTGLAAADRESYFALWEQTFDEHITVSTGYSTYHDNLEKLNARTLSTHNPYVTLNLHPFSSASEAWRDLAFDFAYDFIDNSSSDSLVDNHTHSADLSLSHKLKGFLVGAHYNYVKRFDYAGTSDSNRHGIGAQISRDFTNDYFSLTPFLDYTFIVERNDGPETRDTTSDINYGVQLTVPDRLHFNLTYGRNRLKREIAFGDSVTVYLTASGTLKINERWQLVGAYTRRRNDFESVTPTYDYREDYGEIRLVTQI